MTEITTQRKVFQEGEKGTQPEISLEGRGRETGSSTGNYNFFCCRLYLTTGRVSITMGGKYILY